MADRIITADEARALREAATPGPWNHVGVEYVDTIEPDVCALLSVLNSDAALIAAAPDLAATVEGLHAEVAELRATIAAERGDPAGALPGWEWQAEHREWRRDISHGRLVVSHAVDWVGGWWWHREDVDGFGDDDGDAAFTAREAMRAADASVVPHV